MAVEGLLPGGLIGFGVVAALVIEGALPRLSDGDFDDPHQRHGGQQVRREGPAVPEKVHC